jgi:methionyl-tRNA formyltransferase
VVLVGSVHEARPVFDALRDSDLAELSGVVTHTAERGRQLAGAIPLAGPARAAGVRVIRTEDANAAPVVGAVRRLRPDLLVVVGWNRLIGPELLALPRRGCVGFHASLLPHNRGHAPINWAILRGETTTGNTMMLLDAGVDTGEIIAQTVIPIGPDDTCRTVYDAVGASGARMLTSHLAAILDGSVGRRPQPHIDEAVLPRRTPDMGIIDWRLPAPVVHDWVRALTAPYPGAFASVDGERAMVWATEAPAPGHRSPSDRPPGAVVAVEGDGIRVAVGDGDILVTRMSEPGNEPMHARRWLRRTRRQVSAFDAAPPELAAWARAGRGQPVAAP